MPKMMEVHYFMYMEPNLESPLAKAFDVIIQSLPNV